MGFAGTRAKCRRDANHSSAKPRLPEFLAQSRTMPAGLLGCICYSLSDNGSGVSREGNSLTGRKKDEANWRGLGFRSCTWRPAFNSLWHFPNPYSISLLFLLAFCIPFMGKCCLWTPQLSRTQSVYTQSSHKWKPEESLEILQPNPPILCMTKSERRVNPKIHNQSWQSQAGIWILRLTVSTWYA